MPVAADDEALRRAEFVILRHGETTYNDKGWLSGDPAQVVPLSEAGRAQARALAPRLAPIHWAATFVTRFPRTRETFALALPSGEPAPKVLADLDDINVGEFEAKPREAYRNWRHGHG